jgi:SecD/SecF fusion protein
MLQVPIWVRALVAIILIGGIMIALPNALPENVIQRMPDWLPKDTVSLGLDLQGGSYLLLEVQLDQVEKDKLDSMMADIRVGLRKAKIAFSDLSARNGQVSVRVRDPAQFDQARKILDGLNPQVGGGVLSVGSHEYEITTPGQNRLVMGISYAYL